MPIPMHAKEIYEYLLAHGYSSNAAAGIVGNIEQESGGNPEAGGPGNAGLIQWTPESKASPVSDILTNNAAVDLPNQLRDILTYNQQQGAAAIHQLNSATSPQEAASIYSSLFERPLASAANNPNRESSAQEVAAAARSGKWPSATTGSTGAPAGKPGSASTWDTIWTGITSGLGFSAATGNPVATGLQGAAAVTDPTEQGLLALAAPFVKLGEGLDWFFHPNHWIRIFAGIGGGILFLGGTFQLFHTGSGIPVSAYGVSTTVNVPSSASLPLGILSVGIGALLLFVAFHNLPDTVDSFPSFIGYLTDQVKTGSAKAAA